MWLFENLTKTTLFESKFHFELQNMRIEGETLQGPEGESWDVELHSNGDTKIKKLVFIDST